MSEDDSPHLKKAKRNLLRIRNEGLNQYIICQY